MKVKITWKAFGDKPQIGRFISSVDFETDFKVAEHDMEQFLNVIYRVTNTYSGNLWEILEPKLSPTRTHTALSIGDEVEVDGRAYVCADIGWVKVEDAEIEYLSSEYGNGAVFTVREKVKS